jgi:hypothetical protein
VFGLGELLLECPIRPIDPIPHLRPEVPVCRDSLPRSEVTLSVQMAISGQRQTAASGQISMGRRHRIPQLVFVGSRVSLVVPDLSAPSGSLIQFADSWIRTALHSLAAAMRINAVDTVDASRIMSTSGSTFQDLRIEIRRFCHPIFHPIYGRDSRGRSENGQRLKPW